jgi:hypothetical protein
MLAKTSLYSVFKDPDFLHRRKNVNIIPNFLGLSTPIKIFFKKFLHKIYNTNRIYFQLISFFCNQITYLVPIINIYFT